MNKRILAVVLLLALTISLASCAKGGKDTKTGYETTVLRVAHQRNEVYFSMTPLIIKEKALLEKYLPEGVTVEWKNIDSQTDLRDAAVARQVDIIVVPTSQLVIGTASGMPLIPLSTFLINRAGLYSHSDRIKSLDDIQPYDKIFAASIGNASHTSLMMACKEIYGDSQKFNDNIIPMSYADMWASVETSDDIACALIGFSDTVRADESESLELIFDISDYARQYYLGATAMTTEDFYTKNPVFIEAYQKAAAEAVEFIRNEPAKAAEILVEYWYCDFSVLESELINSPPTYALDEAAYDKLAEFMYEIGAINETPKKFAEFLNYNDIPKVK